jgi:hypothetical protein
MRFEERTVPDHAEPISSTALREGAIYFAVQYLDSGMLTQRFRPSYLSVEISSRAMSDGSIFRTQGHTVKEFDMDRLALVTMS